VALLTDDELKEMRGFVEDEFGPAVSSYIDDYADGWETTDDPETYFDEFIDEIRAAERLGAMNFFQVEDAMDHISGKIERMREKYTPEEEPDYDSERYGGAAVSESSDDIFSDVAE
jgi:hypothetical protein